jgi:hypothetical protein
MVRVSDERLRTLGIRTAISSHPDNRDINTALLGLALAILSLTVSITVGAVAYVAIDAIHRIYVAFDRCGDLAVQAKQTVNAGTATAQGATQTLQVVNQTLVERQKKGVVATITVTGSGLTSMSCNGTCTSQHGSIAIVGGSYTTGTVGTVTWTATPTAQTCMVSEQATAAFHGFSTTAPTTTGFSLTNVNSIAGVTVYVQYICAP